MIVESHGELHAEEKDKGAGKSGAGKGAAASEAVVEVVVPTVDLASSGRRSRASASSGGERPTLPNIGKFDDLEQDAKRCCMVETFDGCRVEIKKMTAMSPMKEAFLGISTSMGSASLPGGYMTSFSGFSGTEAGFVNGNCVLLPRPHCEHFVTMRATFSVFINGLSSVWSRSVCAALRGPSSSRVSVFSQAKSTCRATCRARTRPR